MRASPRSYVTLTLLIAAVPAITAFLVPPSLHPRHFFVVVHRWQKSFTKSPTCCCHPRLHMKSVVDHSADPFRVLDLEPTHDKKEIKRAYKRMALKHHPDVVTNQETPPDKKREANLAFAKINWAYAQLSGKHESTGSTYTTCTSTTTTTSTTSTYTATTSGSYFYTFDPDQTSIDGRDYMPRDRVYQAHNAGGDSFHKKLEDLFNGAAVGPAESLEVNVFGCSHGENDDAPFRTFLKTGSVQEVGTERDDTEYTVWQLEHRRKKLADEWRQADRKLCLTIFYLEKKELEREVADLEANMHVLDGYLQRENERLSALQSRYDHLVMIGKIHGYDRGHASRTRSSRSVSFSSSATNSSSTEGTSSSDSTNSSATLTSVRKDSSSTRGTSSNDKTAFSATPPPPRKESPVAPPPRRQTSTTRHQSSTTTRGTYSNGSTASSSSASSEGGTTWTHDEFGYVYRGQPFASYRYTPPSPPRQESSSTRATYSYGSTASYSSVSSTAKDAWIHDEFGSVYRGPGRESRSTASGSQRQPYSLYTPPPPSRHESFSTRATDSNGFVSTVKGHDNNGQSPGRDTQSTASRSQQQTSSSSTSLPPRKESLVTPQPRQRTSTTRPQSSTTTREKVSDDNKATSASNEEGAGKHKRFGSGGRDSQSAASSSQRQSSSSATPPPPRKESSVIPPPRRQTPSTRPQSSTTTIGEASSDVGTETSASKEEGAGKRKGFGSQGRDSESATSSSQRQSSFSSTKTSPPRKESSVASTPRRKLNTTRPQHSKGKIGTSSYGITIRWSVRLKDNITDDTLSLGEKKVLKVATWPYEFSFRQRAHCIASRMLDEYLRNPDRDRSSPPAPNPEDPAEAVALKVVEFSTSSERIQTVSTIMAEQQMEEKSRTFVNNIPFFANVKGKGNNGPSVKQSANKFVSIRRGSRRRS